MSKTLQIKAGQHVHFIGIAGAGLSAIARILILRGYHISGSDLRANADTQALADLGAIIHQGHHENYIDSSDFIIRSSAVKDNHVEVLAAQAKNIPVYKRSDIIAAIMSDKDTVAIAGTHGKTTTTSMVSHVLIETGQDPSYIVGGAIANTGLNADAGDGQAFVIEADEYDNMFHGLNPQIAVITSVEFDHPDFFKTPDDLNQSFTKFVDKLEEDGLLICCSDDALTRSFGQNRKELGFSVITYGLNADADWRATNIRYENNKTLYDVIADDDFQGTVVLDTPGKHNILNSMVALIIVDTYGVSFADSAKALSSFKGTGRRFDIRAEIDDIIIVDDYAHHPTAIVTTIDATRQRYPKHDLWAVWQPHTFSRTQTLWADYTKAFDEAHHVIVTDIYAAREKAEDFPDVTIPRLLSDMSHSDQHHFPTFDAIVAYLTQSVTSPAVILIMSAGDAPEIGIEFVKQLEAKPL